MESQHTRKGRWNRNIRERGDGIVTYGKGAMESQIIDYAALFSFWIRMRFHTTIPIVMSVRMPAPIHCR